MNSLKEVDSYEFIRFVEFKEELNLSNQQFLKVKQIFINNSEEIIESSQLEFLCQSNVLTQEEFICKSKHIRSTLNNKLWSILRVVLSAIILATILFVLGFVRD